MESRNFFVNWNPILLFAANCLGIGNVISKRDALDVLSVCLYFRIAEKTGSFSFRNFFGFLAHLLRYEKIVSGHKALRVLFPSAVSGAARSPLQKLTIIPNVVLRTDLSANATFAFARPEAMTHYRRAATTATLGRRTDG